MDPLYLSIFIAAARNGSLFSRWFQRSSRDVTLVLRKCCGRIVVISGVQLQFENKRLWSASEETTE
jgi:hypothetical protein